MDDFINPVIYKYEHVEIDGVMRTGLYFQDVHGRDWYETLRSWKGAISTDSNGVVVAYESDVTYMGMEEGRNVYEVESCNVPADVLGNYKYENGIFTDIRPSEKQLFERERNELITEASLMIAPLQDAVDLGMATAEEKESLIAWKKYRVLLMRLDASLAPNIEWPVLPT